MVDVDELFAKHYSRLVRSLSVAFDTESAADAVQEAFIAADRQWNKVGRYDDPASWVRRVALHRLMNRRRNRRRRSEILAGIRPVGEADMSAELLDLREALGRLPDKQRIAICLHYLGGLSVAEIAGDLGVADGTVKSNLHDGRNRLRQLLVEDSHG